MKKKGWIILGVVVFLCLLIYQGISFVLLEALRDECVNNNDSREILKLAVDDPNVICDCMVQETKKYGVVKLVFFTDKGSATEKAFQDAVEQQCINPHLENMQKRIEKMFSQ